jgi:hypothetical protein
LSHEVNEHIKERCYEQAEEEVNRNWHTLEKEWFDNPEKFWQDMIDAKAMVLYNNWRSND